MMRIIHFDSLKVIVSGDPQETIRKALDEFRTIAYAHPFKRQRPRFGLPDVKIENSAPNR